MLHCFLCFESVETPIITQTWRIVYLEIWIGVTLLYSFFLKGYFNTDWESSLWWSLHWCYVVVILLFRGGRQCRRLDYTALENGWDLDWLYNVVSFCLCNLWNASYGLRCCFYSLQQCYTVVCLTWRGGWFVFYIFFSLTHRPYNGLLGFYSFRLFFSFYAFYWSFCTFSSVQLALYVFLG